MAGDHKTSTGTLTGKGNGGGRTTHVKRSGIGVAKAGCSNRAIKSLQPTG